MCPTKANGSSPLVSVVITTFNHAAFVGQCLDGVLAQDCDFPFEVLVVDDCSSDQTRSVLEAYQRRYPGIVIPIFNARNHRSQGLPVMSLGVARSRGAYLAFCDGDDYWDAPNKLARQVAFLKENPDYSFCYHRACDLDGAAYPSSPGQQATDLSMADLGRFYGSILIGTIVMRRPPDGLPVEFDQAPNRDRILPVILGFQGAGKYLDAVGPLIRRLHPAGYWSGKSIPQRHLMHARTDIAIAKYLSRLGYVTEARPYALGALRYFNCYLGTIAADDPDIDPEQLVASLFRTAEPEAAQIVRLLNIVNNPPPRANGSVAVGIQS